MRTGLWFMAAVVGTAAVLTTAGADDAKTNCEAGCKFVEEIVYKEVPKFTCKIVPNVKKKWVYSCFDDAFCFTHTPCAKHGCEKCPTCQTYCRKLLVKRQVEHCVGSKCVIEKTMEVVPCKVTRKVPCMPAPEALPPPLKVAPQK
jgi:hypothetical protein